jgi:phosphoserine phosphatase
LQEGFPVKELEARAVGIRLVMWDMDGVIFEGHNFWLELHKAFGTEQKGVVSANKYLSTDYDRLVEIVAGDLWKGRLADIYYEMIHQRRYHPGVKEVFAFLKTYHVRTAIISSGPYDLARRAQVDLGIDIIRANRLIIEDGAIEGSVDVMVPDGEKKRVGLEVMAELGINAEHAAYVGDSDSDVELAELVDYSVAYNTNSNDLIEACDITLKYGELGLLPDLFMQT